MRDARGGDHARAVAGGLHLLEQRGNGLAVAAGAGAVVVGVIGLARSVRGLGVGRHGNEDRKSTRLNSSHSQISYAVFCLKKKNIWKLTDSILNAGTANT